MLEEFLICSELMLQRKNRLIQVLGWRMVKVLRKGKSSQNAVWGCGLHK